MLYKLRTNVRLLGVNRIPLMISGVGLLAIVAVATYIRIKVPRNYDPYAIMPILNGLSDAWLVLWLLCLLLLPFITGILSARLTLGAFFSDAHAMLSLEIGPFNRVLAFVALSLYRLQSLILVIVMAIVVSLESYIIESEHTVCIPEDAYCNSLIGPVQIVSVLGLWSLGLFLLSTAVGVYWAFRWKSNRAYVPAGLLSLMAGGVVLGVYYLFFWARRPLLLPEILGVALTFLLALLVMRTTKALTWTQPMPHLTDPHA